MDGRNRYRACTAVGITPRCEQVELDDVDVLHFVIDENVHRRHLDATQKAMAGVKILEHEESLAAKRKAEGQRKGGQTAGRGRPIA